MDSWCKLTFFISVILSTNWAISSPESDSENGQSFMTDEFEEFFDVDDASESELFLCEDTDLDDFNQELDDCMLNAQKSVDEALLRDESVTSVREAICTAISRKLTCVKDIGPKCLDENKIERMRIRVIDESFVRAFKNSGVLGDDFVETCPVLLANERDVQLAVAGSTECRYMDFIRRFFDVTKCVAETNIEQDTDGDFLDHYGNIASSLLPCYDDIIPCLSSSFVCKLNNSQAEFFEIIENIRKPGGIEKLKNLTFSKCEGED